MSHSQQHLGNHAGLSSCAVQQGALMPGLRRSDSFHHLCSAQVPGVYPAACLSQGQSCSQHKTSKQPSELLTGRGGLPTCAQQNWRAGSTKQAGAAWQEAARACVGGLHGAISRGFEDW